MEEKLYRKRNYTFTIPEIKLPEEFGVWIDKNSTDQLNQMQQFLGTTSYFPQGHGDKRYENGPFAVELAHHEYIKVIREWVKDTFTVKVANVFHVRTAPRKNGLWHCEGPALSNRRVTFNFLVRGEVGNTGSQWGINPDWTDTVNPLDESAERNGQLNTEDQSKIQVVDEITNDTMHECFAYNTTFLHRSINEHSDTERVLLSVTLPEMYSIELIRKMHNEGKLIK